MKKGGERMLTIKDLMEKYKVSRTAIYNWINKGLPVLKIGGVVRFDQEQVNAWIEQTNRKESNS